MATKGQIFFAGVGTAFAILAMGFGGGLLMANSALHEAPVPKHAAAETPAAMRVVLPTTEKPPVQVTPIAQAETALVAPTPQILPQVTPTKTEDEQRLAETSKQSELARQKKMALSAERAFKRKAKEAALKRRQQYAQQIARREFAREKQKQALQSYANQREPGLLAFGTDDQPTASGFFGN